MTKKQLLSPAYRSIYLIDSRNSICQFFLLQLFLIYVKTGKQYIIIGHSHRKACMTLPAFMTQSLLQHLLRKPGIIPTGTNKNKYCLLYSFKESCRIKLSTIAGGAHE